MDELITGITQTRFGEFEYIENDAVMGASLREYGEFCELETKVLCELIEPNSTVVVSRSAIGFQTMGIAEQVGNSGFVYSFEPDPLLHRLQIRNTVKFNSVIISERILLSEGIEQDRINSLLANVPSDIDAIISGTSSEAPTTIQVDARSLDSYRLNACHLIVSQDGDRISQILDGATETIFRHEPYVYFRPSQANPVLAGMSHEALEGYSFALLRTKLFNRLNIHSNLANMFGNVKRIGIIAVPSGKLMPRKFDNATDVIPFSTSEELTELMKSTPILPSSHEFENTIEVAERRILALQTEVSDLEFRMLMSDKQSIEEIQKLLREIELIVNSRSWRITSPLRKISTFAVKFKSQRGQSGA